MKASSLPSLFAGALVVGCGSTVSLEDLACPCAVGFVCCAKVCVAEGSCEGDKLIVPGSDDAGGPLPRESSTSSGATTSMTLGFPPPHTGTNGATRTTGGATSSERSSASTGSATSTGSSSGSARSSDLGFSSSHGETSGSGSSASGSRGSSASSGTTTVIVTPLHTGVGLMTLDDQNVIYTDHGNENIYVVPKDGSTAPVLVVANQTGINKIMGAGSTILWSTLATGKSAPSSVYGAADAVPPAITSTLVSDANMYDWTTDGDNLLWLDTATNVTITMAPLTSSLMSGPGLGPSTVVADNLAAAFSPCGGCNAPAGKIAATGSEVVWALSHEYESVSVVYALWSSLYDGTQTASIGSGGGDVDSDVVSSLATSGPFAYYVLGSTSIEQTEISPPGSTPSVNDVDDGISPAVLGLAFDSTRIYWIADTTEVFTRLQSLADYPAPWISGKDFAAITAEPGFVYVADNEAGTITRYVTP